MSHAIAEANRLGFTGRDADRFRHAGGPVVPESVRDTGGFGGISDDELEIRCTLGDSDACAEQDARASTGGDGGGGGGGGGSVRTQFESERQLDLASAQRAVADAEAALANAETARRNATTAADRQEADAAFQRAQIKLDQARLDFDKAQSGIENALNRDTLNASIAATKQRLEEIRLESELAFKNEDKLLTKRLDAEKEMLLLRLDNSMRELLFGEIGAERRALIAEQGAARRQIGELQGKDPFRQANLLGGQAQRGRTPAAKFGQQLQSFVNQPLPQANLQAPIAQLQAQLTGAQQGPQLPQAPNIGLAQGGVIEMGRGSDGAFSMKPRSFLVGEGAGIIPGITEVLTIQGGKVTVSPLMGGFQDGGTVDTLAPTPIPVFTPPTPEPKEDAAPLPTPTTGVLGLIDFLSGQGMTRGEVAQFLSYALGLAIPNRADVSPSLLGSDVNPNDPLAPFISAVMAAGIFVGHADGTFRPNDVFTRFDAIADNLTNFTVQSLPTSTDAQAIQDWLSSFPDVPVGPPGPQPPGPTGPSPQDILAGLQALAPGFTGLSEFVPRTETGPFGGTQAMRDFFSFGGQNLVQDPFSGQFRPFLPGLPEGTTPQALQNAPTGFGAPVVNQGAFNLQNLATLGFDPALVRLGGQDDIFYRDPTTGELRQFGTPDIFEQSGFNLADVFNISPTGQNFQFGAPITSPLPLQPNQNTVGPFRMPLIDPFTGALLFDPFQNASNLNFLQQENPTLFNNLLSSFGTAGLDPTGFQSRLDLATPTGRFQNPARIGFRGGFF